MSHDQPNTNEEQQRLVDVRPERGPGAQCACGRPGCIIPAGKRAHARHASASCRQADYRSRHGEQGDAARSEAFWTGLGQRMGGRPDLFRGERGTDRDRRAQRGRGHGARGTTQEPPEASESVTDAA